MPIVWSTVSAILLPHLGGWLGDAIVKPNVKWFETLNKPSWNSPNWAFIPIRVTLYTGMGYASYLVWRDGGGFEGNARLPLALYVSQLILHWIWAPVFFGAHHLFLSLINIGLLYINVAACGYYFYRINIIAGLLMAPYLAMLSFSAYMNYYIYKHNPSTKNKKEMETKEK